MDSDITSTRPINLKPKNPMFLCVLSYTGTCEIPGITVAGANPTILKYTPAADAEYLYNGRCNCISTPPATPDGKPTPAVITRAALNLGHIPILVVNAGALVKPSIPFIDFGLKPGSNISLLRAMDLGQVEQAVSYGKIVGRQLSRNSDLIIIGESIPGGTTTALAVLCALGIDARFKVSSSMVDNPHELKNKVVEAAFLRQGHKLDSVQEVVSAFGDPMMASVAGLAAGAIDGGSTVLLAGGTQMAAVLAVLKGMCDYRDKICIGTTKYVFEDRASSLTQLVNLVDPAVPVIACDPYLHQSSISGLEAFAHGFVKEGVGAGGACIATMKTAGSVVDGTALLQEIEKEYRDHIQLEREA